MITSRRIFFRGLAAASLASGVLPTWPKLSLGDAGEFSAPIRLDKNENAYGVSREASVAIGSSVLSANRYPTSERQQLKEAIAKLHQVLPQQVILAGGSSQILRAAVMASLGVRAKVIVASPTFGVVSNEARRVGLPSETVPLTREYAHDLEKMLSLTHGFSGLVYICNPNNPTGSLTARRDLEVFLNEVPSSFLIVIDEAYHDYVPVTQAYSSFIDNPVSYRNLIVTRTFSKIGGLAGERIGYAVTSRDIVKKLPSDELESSVSMSALVGARATLESQFLPHCARLNADDRQEFLNQINARHGHAVDPHTNFVFMHSGRLAKDVVAYFEKHGILIGSPVPEMDTYVRVSLGLPEEMKVFWRVWDSLIPAGSMHM